MTEGRAYDPTIYRGSAAHYARGRPAYSAELASTLASEVLLDGRGRFLDVGCGPGILINQLAGFFSAAVGLDPDADMLAEARHLAGEAGVRNVRWLQGRAEDIPLLDLGVFRLVTFGQSFHWTDRERTAESVYEILEPGGALALIVHTHAGRPQPVGPGHPPIPHAEIRALISRYLGSRLRAGRGYSSPPPDRYEHALERTRFGAPRVLFAPGRADIVQDADGVLSNYYSMSFAAPHLFGADIEAFERDVRAVLAARSPTGLFWDWPGDTEILIATKPASRIVSGFQT
jgi:SAM-dependent methyltransferase